MKVVWKRWQSGLLRSPSWDRDMKRVAGMDQHRRGSQSAAKRPAEPPSVAEIINSGDPFAVLGPHEVGPGRWEIRVIRPDADTITLVGRDGETVLGSMERRLPEGYFVGSVGASERPDYRLRVERHGRVRDPSRSLQLRRLSLA